LIIDAGSIDGPGFEKMRLVENIPVDTHAIANLIKGKNDLFLVWPAANYPFDHGQWLEALNLDEGNRSFFIYDDRELIGHAALRRTEIEGMYALWYLYLLPGIRSKGLGARMMALLEDYAMEKLSARELVLRTRTYNPGAVRCYEKAGFKEFNRDGTLIHMSKVLKPG
jgi:RimJ/RimL family protein N-acetyltransferase